jgi:DNA-directed RNA polymerase I subunit RPA12
MAAASASARASSASSSASSASSSSSSAAAAAAAAAASQPASKSFAQPSWGSLFCPQCSSILNVPTSSLVVACPDCPFETTLARLLHLFSDNVNRNAHAHAEARARHSRGHAHHHEDDEHDAAASAAAAGGAHHHHHARARATIEQPCDKCGHPRLFFHTAQLRSADEGSTVFYECPNCGHSYSVNN